MILRHAEADRPVLTEFDLGNTSVFRGAEESYPPEDEPYARFVVGL